MEQKIQHVAIIGLGALGINFGNYLTKQLPKGNVRIIANKERIQKYEREGVFENGKRCEFSYHTDDEIMEPADLVLFCVKFNGLYKAMDQMKKQIGKDTIIMSALNGISSEAILQKEFPNNHVIYTVAQGMDATKIGNELTCAHMGCLCFGDKERDRSQSADVKKVAAFFSTINFPYKIKEDILRHQWGKLMLNVGLNQIVAVHRGTYATIQVPGTAREEMLSAMREVINISKKVGIHLNEQDLSEWMALTDTLHPLGKPSMAQDIDAKRKTEVHLFAGTICELGAKYALPCPENESLWKRIIELEASFEQ